MIRYRPLFQVDVAHDYFQSRGDVVLEAQPDADRAALTGLYSVGRFLEVVPDPKTARVMAGHKMLFRPLDSGFVVAVQVDPTAPNLRPWITFAPDLRLAFGLRLVDPGFANYTELGPDATGFYRFGNDSLNRTAGTNFLSRRVPGFDATRRYVAGEIRSELAGPTFDLFLALRDTGPTATPVAADWRRIPADTWSASVTYPTGALVLSSNQLFRALVDGPGNNFSNAAEWQPAGVLGNQYVGVADAAVAPNASASDQFGVIEITPSSGDFALLNPDGTLRTPRYVLRFLNRATRWRYIFPSPQAVGTGAEVAPEAGNNHILVTAAPRPLTRFGAGTRLQADNAATTTVSEEVLLPAPETHRVRRQNAEWYSETHLPNLTVGP